MSISSSAEMRGVKTDTPHFCGVSCTDTPHPIPCNLGRIMKNAGCAGSKRRTSHVYARAHATAGFRKYTPHTPHSESKRLESPAFVARGVCTRDPAFRRSHPADTPHPPAELRS